MANEFIARKGLIALEDSQITGSLSISQNLNVIGGLTASFDSSTSTAISGAFTSVSSSIASERLKNTTDTLTGDLTVTGTITAQEFHTEFVSASIIYESGSTKFGDTYDDVHEFTGSVNVTNSTGGVTGSLAFYGGGLTLSGDDADFNLNITSGSALADLAEFRFQVDGGTMGRLYMHKGTKHMYLGPTTFPTSSLYLQDGTGTVMSITGSSVGIGTTSPGSKLDIAVVSGDSNQVRISANENIYKDLQWKDTTSGEMWIWSHRIHSDGNKFMAWYYDGTSYNSSPAITFSTNNNVGIGTTSASGTYGKLTVNGSISLLDDQNTKLEIGRYSAGASNSYIKLGANSNSLRITNNTDTADLLYIQNDGKVGIGVTPSQKLTIDQNVSGVNQGIPATTGTTQNGILRLQPGGPYGESLDFGMNVATTYGWIQATNKGNLGVNYNLSLNPNGGNVGIGTTSPVDTLNYGRALDIQSSTGAAVYLRDLTDTAKYGLLAYDGESNNRTTIGALGTDNYLRFVTVGTERMRIDASGYIRTNPGGGLNGALLAEGTEYSIKSVGTQTGYTQGAIVLSSGTDSVPSARGQGVFYFNEGNDVTWYSGGLYNSADRFDICRKSSTTSIDSSTAQSTYSLFHLNNAGSAYNATGTWGTISSDQRLKENIVDATSKLDDVLSLQVRNFNYIGKEEKYIGFIAQELETVFPSLVTTNDTREYDREGNVLGGLEDTKGVKVGMDFAILVKAIQEQQAIIEDLKARIETLEG